MSSLDKQVFRLIAGKPLEGLEDFPTIDQSIDDLLGQIASKHPLVRLGTSPTEGPISLADEDRGAMHILGAPRQGKSKLLELLIRHGIKNGQGATLLDPSAGGQTAKDVLRYCAKVGYEKVVYIDPHDFLKYKAIPCINPIKYKAPVSAVADNLMSVIQTSWGQKEYSATPRIEKYLPALIAVLHATGNEYKREKAGYTGPTCAVTDLVNFSDRDRYKYRSQLMLSALDYYSPERAMIEAAFKNAKEWDGFLPTVNRFNPFLEETMERMFGSTKGLNFTKLITEKYLIIVNLDPTGILRRIQRVLIGTLILAQLQYTIERLKNAGNGHGAWKGKHYVYVDECGQFANRQLADFLYEKPKIGLVFNFAHHSFSQFEDAYAKAAIRNTTPLKLMFWVGNPDDRLTMMKDLGYGGELSDREVSFALDQTARQEAVLRNNKKRPLKFTLADVPDSGISDQVLQDFKKTLYAQREFYRTPDEVRAEINNRFATKQTGTATAAPKAGDGPQPNIKHTASTRGRQKKSTDPGTGTRKEAEPSPASEGVPPGPEGPDFSALLSQRRKKQP